MDFDTAKSIMDDITVLNGLMSGLSQKLDKLEEPERGNFMLALGKVMGETYLGMIYPIGQQHPSLDPLANDAK